MNNSSPSKKPIRQAADRLPMLLKSCMSYCRILFIFICTALSVSVVQGQVEDVHLLDIDLLHEKISTNRLTEDSVAASLVVIRHAVQLTKKRNDQDRLAKLYELMAVSYRADYSSEPNQDSVLFYYQLALAHYKTTNNEIDEANIYTKLGLYYKGIKMFLKGEEYLFRALEIHEKSNNTASIAHSYNALCEFCLFKKIYTDAVKYGERGLAKAKEVNLIDNAYFQYWCLIRAYRKLGMPEQTIKLVDDYLMAVDSGITDDRHEGAYLNQRFLAHSALNDRDAMMQDLIEIKKRKLISPEENPDGWPPAYYYLTGDYNRTLAYYLQNVERLDAEDSEFLETDFIVIVDSYEQLGQLDKALEYQTKALKYYQRKASQELEAVKNEIQVKYETAEKTATISEQEQHIKEQKKSLQIVFALAALFSIISAGLIYFSRINRRKNKQLAELTDKLQELDEFKSRFYTNITHEFRTPLTVMLGMTDGIEGHQQAKTLIKRNGEQLMRLINQLLDLSKLEAKTLAIKTSYQDVIVYLKFLTESFYSMAKDKGVQLTFYAETDHLFMDFDDHKMQNIIYNLLSNAIKFTEADGKVIVHVREIKADPISQLQIIVKDTGIGIAIDSLHRLFDRFYQADNSSTRKAEGTGIGLAFSRELIELLDGSIQVKSELGVGSEFTVLLPIVTRDPNTVSAPKPSITKQPTTIPIEYDDQDSLSQSDVPTGMPLALIVEDNRDVMEYIKGLLQKTYEVKTAVNGQRGIEQAIECIPDIIISDVMMPIKDGYALCDTLKQDQRTSHIPIILLTAKAGQTDRLEGLGLGADAYITKPFQKEELFIRLKQLVALRKSLHTRYSQVSTIAIATPQNIEDEFLSKARAIVMERLDDSEFNVASLGDRLQMSKMQCYRKFKALTDKSPSEFIRSTRLAQAKLMLESTDKNIAEIAYATGFNDPNYFSRRFQKEFGHPPRSIRN